MTTKAVLTTGDAARHCHVSSETVANWIRSGKLKAYMTPGQHRRIHVGDFRTFLRAHDMPPFGEDYPGRRKVLVVDDDPDIVRLITKFLSGNDEYELGTASGGFEAGIQVAKFRPDLVILDLMIPDIDGFKVCREIKSNPDTRHIMVLVVTGYAEEENIQKALQHGADYCMKKPLNLNELKEKIDEFFAIRASKAFSAEFNAI